MRKTKLQKLEDELRDIEICLSKKNKEIEDHKRRYCGERIRITDQYLLNRPSLFKEKLYERNGKLYEKSVYDG